MSSDSTPSINVGTHERLLSAILGTLALTSALRHRSVFRLVTASALYYRAFTGHCHAYEALDIKLEPDAPKE